jgi:glutamate--cysteine ligase
MGFFHFRVKSYIEIRIADAVPLQSALGYVSLIKGIVYSDSALTLLDNELSGINSAERIQDAIELIKKDGFDAVIYNNKTAREWAEHLIGIASGNTNEEEREYLNHVRTVCSNSKSQNNGQQYA